MAKHNRVCMTCGKKYSFCPSCSKADAKKAPWHATFCCEDCQVIWKTLTKFSMGLLSKIEAKEILSKIELKPIETSAECVQSGLKNIMAEDEVVIVAEDVAEPSIEEEQPQPEVLAFFEVAEQPVVEQPIEAEVAIEPVVAQPKYYSKKNRRKAHVVVQEEN